MALKENQQIENFILIEKQGEERLGEIWRVKYINTKSTLAESESTPREEIKVVSNSMFANRYMLIYQLGKGGFGEVWKALDTKTNINVALKIHNESDTVQAVNAIVADYKKTYGLTHPNLLIPNNVDIIDGRTAFLEMELCESIDDKYFDEQEIWKFIRDISNGLAHLANNKRWSNSQHKSVAAPIVHQDIKPDNILFRKSLDQYVIADFGISKTRLKSLVSTDNETHIKNDVDSCMTTAYAAPERFSVNSNQSTVASDIWSFGATLFELVEGTLPFAPELGGKSMTSAIGMKIPAITNEDYSLELKHLIYDCMALNPQDRPTAEQLHNYAQLALNGEKRQMVWNGAPANIKTDTAKRKKDFKGKPEGSDPDPWFKMKYLWILLVCIAVVGVIIFLKYKPVPPPDNDTIEIETELVQPIAIDTSIDEPTVSTINTPAPVQNTTEQNKKSKKSDAEIAYTPKQCNSLGDYYLKMDDEVKAAEWYRKAAEQGYAEAQYNLGRLYSRGEGGVEKNNEEAKKWYRKAAEQGNVDGQVFLGHLYIREDDYVEAAKWYRKAAEQGDAEAQCYLGVLYYNGQGVKQDYVEAVKWFRKAANLIPHATYCLAICYRYGDGVEKNLQMAFHWAKKAAEYGSEGAQEMVNDFKNKETDEKKVYFSEIKQKIKRKTYSVHLIMRGETLYQIARTYGVNESDLFVKGDPHFISFGDTVWVPIQ